MLLRKVTHPQVPQYLAHRASHTAGVLTSVGRWHQAHALGRVRLESRIRLYQAFTHTIVGAPTHSGPHRHYQKQALTYRRLLAWYKQHQIGNDVFMIIDI